METRLNEKMCNFKIGACYKNTKYDPKSDTLRGVKYFIYCGENTFTPICDDEYVMNVRLKYDTIKDFVEVTKDEAFRNVKDVNINDNEVKEITEMQRKIDSYEAFILATSFLIMGKDDIDYPIFARTQLDHQMNRIWKFVKEHK